MIVKIVESNAPVQIYLAKIVLGRKLTAPYIVKRVSWFKSSLLLSNIQGNINS
jgi:hypothetical protein